MVVAYGAITISTTVVGTVITMDVTARPRGRAAQIPAERALFERYLREHRDHGRWALASRASNYFTLDDLNLLMDDYIALLNHYGYTREEAPPEARRMQLRMFHIPEDPTTPLRQQ